MKYIIGAIIGAIIGYLTNWIAIRMLFRPYEEKRLFGMKVPFTPGLIPKEQKRIAKSVGDAVGEHLLTPEIISKELYNDNLRKKLRGWIAEKVQKLSEDESTVRQVLLKVCPNRYEGLKKAMVDSTSSYIASRLSSEETLEKLEPMLMKSVDSLVDKDSEAVINFLKDNGTFDTLAKAITEYKKGEELKNQVFNLFDKKAVELLGQGKTFGELIPKELNGSIKVLVYNYRYDMAREIKKILNRDATQQDLRNFVAEAISRNLNPLVAAFVNADSITEKVVNELNSYLSSEEGVAKIASFAVDFIEKLSNKNIKEILEKLPEGSSDSIKNHLYTYLTDSILDEDFIANFVAELKTMIKEAGSLENLLNKALPAWRSKLSRLLRELLIKALSDSKVEAMLKKSLTELVSKLEEKQVNKIISREDPQLREDILTALYSYADKFMEEKAPAFISSIDFASMVEKQINSFQVDYAEKIIVGIAEKELKAITWLGALLGGILGILSPLLSSLY